MFPIIGAIIALATISTAGVSAYYAIVKPMIVNSKDEKEKAELLAKRDDLIKSWVDCGIFPGLEGSGIYTVRTSLLKELDIYNMETSFNVIKFINGPSPAINGTKITNVGLENVLEITVKSLGTSRIICKDITIYYIKDRIRLESKVIPKKRTVTISESKNIQYEVSRDILSIDFGDFISITEPEMNEYQIQHISFDLYSDKTVPIMINILMKNRDYLFLTCSYKNVLTMTFIDDMSIIGGCSKSAGHVSAVIEQNDLSVTDVLPLNLRPNINKIIEDTIPDHFGMKGITKIKITNDGPETITIEEIGIYYYDNNSKFIKYNNLIFTKFDVQADENSETDLIDGEKEIFEIKIIAKPNVMSSRIFIDLYNENDFRRISTCIFDNIVHLTLYREAGPGGLTFSAPSLHSLTALNTCSNSFSMNGYYKAYEFELIMQYPTLVSFTQQSIIDIEGMLPNSYGIPLTELEFYTPEPVVKIIGFTIYYIDEHSRGGIRKLILTSLEESSMPSLVANIVDQMNLIDSHNYHIYRIKIQATDIDNIKFTRFFLKMKTATRDYIISSCIGFNTFYLDLVGSYPVNIVATCDFNMPKQVYAEFKFQNLDYFSNFEPHTINNIEWSPSPKWHTTGSSLIGKMPGNIRNPATGIYAIAIGSDISTITNTSVGVYYKFPNETIIRYKQLTRYLINVNDYNSSANITPLNDGNVIINNNQILICSEEQIGFYEIYELEIVMDNIYWSQVGIALLNHMDQSYTNVICMRSGKINIPIFGKTIDTVLMRNLLTCNNVMKGQAYVDVDIASIQNRLNIAPYYEHCIPLTMTYANVLTLERTDKNGFMDITEINIVNIGDVKIELWKARYYYTIAGIQDVAHLNFTLKDDNNSPMVIPASIQCGIKYSLIPINNTGGLFDDLKIHRLEFYTAGKATSQLEIAISAKVKDLNGAIMLKPDGSPVIKTAIFVCCISGDTSVTSINFM